MAGIGFALERMTQGRGLTTAIGAYLYATILVAGPWIFMVLAIAGVGAAACPQGHCANVQVFRSIVIYNSVFSLIVTGPIAFVCTRFVSDRIFVKRYESIPFSFVAGFFFYALIVALVACPYYVFFSTLTGPERIAGLQNLLLTGASWLLIPYMGAVKGYRAVSFAFAIGAAAMVGSVIWAPVADRIWLVHAFNIGLTVINAVMMWRIAREYGSKIVPDWDLVRTAFTRWELPLIGAAYYLGIWIDKLIMWIAAPQGAVRVEGAFQTMPDYDTAMFYAQLTSLPVLAVFFVHVETGFYRLWRGFYGRFEHQVSRREMELAMAKMGRFVISSVFGLFVMLTSMCVLAILVSFVAIDPLGLRAAQMGILRSALVGVVCHTSAMFCFIFLLYFDLRRQALFVALTFLFLNGAFTAALLPLGFRFYGLGFTLASAITLVVALGTLSRELPWLHYHAFVTNNPSTKDASKKKKALSPEKATKQLAKKEKAARKDEQVAKA